jgi:threonine aldolase
MIVDLRSDVLSRPSPAMMEAMMRATMGDDVFCEDETVLDLQRTAAGMTGKEAGLFVVSGTMANQLAIASQTAPHDEVVLDINSHIFQFEQGMPAVLSGVQLRPIAFVDSLPPEDILASSIRFPDIHHPVSRLVCLEVTHNYNGGAIPDFKKFQSACQRAKGLGLKIHLDGARVFNAAVASGISVKDFASECDTMMFCFSKGLGAPIGSMLVGPKATIERARYIRKGLGGGWRQPGMLAAAARYALENNVSRLADDHRRARQIADAIEANGRFFLARRVDTNMVFFGAKDGKLEQHSATLTKRGIIHDWKHFNLIRLVTYVGIGDDMAQYTCDCIKEL